MKQVHKIGLSLAFLFSLQGHQILCMQSIDFLWKSICNQFVLSSCDRAFVGAATGFTLTVGLLTVDYLILSLKGRNGESFDLSSQEFNDLPSDVVEQRNLYSQNIKNIAADKLMGEELKKAQEYHGNTENIYSFKKTNTGFLHKMYTHGTISGSLTKSDTTETSFQPQKLVFDKSTIQNRRWTHAICGGLIVGGAIAGTYVVGNVTQK